MANTTAVAVAMLLAESSITSVFSTRIYAPTLPEAVFDSPTFPILRLFRRGGMSHEIIGAEKEPSYQVEVYHSTAAQAGSAYDVVTGFLQSINHLTVGSSIVEAATEEVMGTEGVDPKTEWDYVRGFWTLLIHDL